MYKERLAGKNIMITGAAQGMGAANAKYDEFKSTLQTWKDEGVIPSKVAVEDLLTQLGLTDDTWEAEIKLTGLDKAKLQLELIELMLQGVTHPEGKAIHTAAIEAAAEGDWEKVEELLGQAKWIDENPTVAAKFDYDVTQYLKVGRRYRP